MTTQAAAQRSSRKGMARGGLIFLLAVIVAYVLGLVLDPERTRSALSITINTLTGIILPLSFVFVALLLTNRYLRAESVSRLVGAESGLKGSTLALVAGVISMGPAYAWYPLLGEVRRQGAGAGQVAVFLYGRAVKPFLLPFMAAYFGLVFTIILNVLIAAAALVTGWIMGHLFSSTYGHLQSRRTDDGRLSGH